MTYGRRDWLTAALISLFILILAAFSVTAGVNDWGDDFAGYINEGMAIADGRFDGQTALNYQQHPTPTTRESTDGKLIYAWGYPLAQALIYRIVGFDRTDYSSVIWYKIPLVLSLALLGGVLYLFFRRRFRWETALFLALLFCANGELYAAINRLYSDIPFLFLSCLTLLLMECYADGKSRTLGLAYGFALWLTHETRLNGLTICAVALTGHLFRLGTAGIRREGWRALLPYATFVALTVISERLWLAPATANISEVGAATSAQIHEHVRYYWNMVFRYFSDMPGMTVSVVGYVMAGLCLIGALTRGIARENLHLTFLLAGTLAVVVMLPYTQGLRYLYNVLPIMLMYVVYGGQILLEKTAHKARGMKRAATVGLALIYVVAAELLFFPCAAQITRDYINLTHWGGKDENDVYTDEAVEVYRYIRANTPEEAVIAFAKPRALYLNTGRNSFRPGVNGHEVTDADYFLFCKLKYGDFSEVDPNTVQGTPVLENEWFTLYEIEAGER